MSDDRPASITHGERICFDYMDVLSTLCKKHWSFRDAIYGVMPIFGMVLKADGTATATGEQLHALALQVISTQVSDETNIIRLIMLARQQGFPELDILLPYPLTPEQLQTIEQGCNCRLRLTQTDERLSVHPLP